MKEDFIWSMIEKIAENGGGFFRTSEAEQAGIRRDLLKRYVDSGKLIRVRKGLYRLADELTDEFALIQTQSSKAVFSYGTALYLLGMSDIIPHNLDVTVPHGTNTTTVRKNNESLLCHYVQPHLYEIGISETVSPYGTPVRLYNRERCICDLVRNKDRVEMQLYSQALKEYFKTEPNPRRLLKYSKAFGVEDKIRTYMEVLL